MSLWSVWWPECLIRKLARCGPLSRPHDFFFATCMCVCVCVCVCVSVCLCLYWIKYTKAWFVFIPIFLCKFLLLFSICTAFSSTPTSPLIPLCLPWPVKGRLHSTLVSLGPTVWLRLWWSHLKQNHRLRPGLSTHSEQSDYPGMSNKRWFTFCNTSSFLILSRRVNMYCGCGTGNWLFDVVGITCLTLERQCFVYLGWKSERSLCMYWTQGSSC